MTLEQIVECDAETLEKMDDATLLKHFQQYLCVTRPEQAVRKSNSTKTNEVVIPNKQMEILKKLQENDPSIDIAFIQSVLRKKK